MHKNCVKVVIMCFLTICMFFSVSYADEISDLKKEIEQLKKTQEEYLGLINKQSEQLASLKNKVDRLETQRAVPGAQPADLQEKVEVLEQKVMGPGALQVNYKDGIRFTTEDKVFDLKIGGRLQYDAAWFSEDPDLRNRVGKLKDGGTVRRGRFYMSGAVYENLIYKLEYDLAADPVALRDAYIGVRNIPYLGTVRAGHFFEPFGLENLTSTNYMSFVEFGLSAAFFPGRNTGIEMYSTAFDKRFTWETGVFRDADNQGDFTSSEYNWTSRITGLPVYEDDGKLLLHVGASYSLSNPAETLSYSSGPECSLAPAFVDTGDIAAKDANIFGAEAAIVNGPFCVQGEYVGSYVNQKDVSDYPYFQGGYVYLSYFLTGEHRPYNMSRGVFSRLRPENNFSIKDGTYGAWELAARYSHLDLKDEGISGGVLNDFTLGINWYLSPNMRVMGNYIHSHLNGAGDADIFLTRLQVDF